MTIPQSKSRISDTTAALASRSEVRIGACLDSGLPLPAELIEFTHRDIYFKTDRPLRFGTQVNLVIFADLVSAIARDSAIVHWCRIDGQGWKVGAFLAHPLSDRILNFAADNLRSQIRYECHCKAWIRSEESGEIHCVVIVDYSSCGMRVISNAPIAVGTPFSLFGTSGAGSKTVLAGITRWCRDAEEGYSIGCDIEKLRGLEIPRLFVNHTALHVDYEDDRVMLETCESLENLRTEVCGHEEFRPAIEDLQFTQPILASDRNA